MIVKIFVFLFINSYASFYYLAFLAENLGDCPAQGCMYALAINLAVVFGSSLASSACLQLILPYLQYQYSYYAAVGGGADRCGGENTGAGAAAEADGATRSSSNNNKNKRKGRMARISRPEREHLLATVSQQLFICWKRPINLYISNI